MDVHLVRVLLKAIADVVSVSTLAAGLDTLKTEVPDLVVLDINLPNSTGMRTIHTFREHYPDIPALVFSGDRDVIEEATELGETAINKNGLDFASFADAVRSAAWESKLVQVAVQLAETREALCGRDGSLDRIAGPDWANSV